MRSRFLLGLVLVVLGGGCGKLKKLTTESVSIGGGDTPDAAKVTPQGTLKPGDLTDWAQPPHVEILYKGTTQYGWGIAFAGMRPDLSQVVVVEGTAWCDKGNCGPQGFDVEIIDYAKKARVERWHADKDLGCLPTANVAVFADDLRWSKLNASLGVPKQSATEIPRFLPLADKVLFIGCASGTGQNWIMAADLDGKSPRPVGRIHQGKNDVFPSPDGKHVAWTYSGMIPRYPHGEGPTGAPRTPSELHIAPTDAGEYPKEEPPDRVLSIPKESIGWPIWSRDGARIYLTTFREEDMTSCLVWVDPAKLETPQQVVCGANGPRIHEYIEAKTGTNAVIVSYSHMGDTQLAWLDRTTGKTKATRKVPADHNHAVVLDPTGTMAVVEGKKNEIVVVDLATGKSGAIKAQHGYYLSLERSQWIDAKRFVLFNLGNHRHYQIVAVDTAALLKD